MKKHTWFVYVFWILLTEAVGFLSGWLTSNSTQMFNEVIAKPPLSPPAILFPIVWTLLYALMGVGAARVNLSPLSKEQRKSILLFLTQLTLNFFWSPIFFDFQAFGIAFILLLLLWGLVRQMIVFFGRTDPLAAYLQLPYLLWLTFAAYLNAGIWYLNRP